MKKNKTETIVVKKATKEITFLLPNLSDIKPIGHCDTKPAIRVINIKYETVSSDSNLLRIYTGIIVKKAPTKIV